MRKSAALALLFAAACTDAPEKRTRTYNFHAIGGVSMGAIGTAFLAGSGDNHRRFDAIAGLGGPMDAAYFLGSLERGQIGGFCSREQILALLQSDPERFDDPAALDCGATEHPFYELPQDFNHWRFTTNGGTFDRSAYLDMFHDLAVAMGNPLYYNPDSPIFPAKGISRLNFDANLCANPVVLEGFYNKEYNPTGEYPVITFCDGEEPIYYCDDAEKTPVDFCSGKSAEEFCRERGAVAKTAGKTPSQNNALYYAKKGAYDPCFTHNEPVPFGLAVDYNRNGRRDYHEPIVLNGHERWDDTGKDGCANDREDGKGGCTASGAQGDRNADDFDPVLNPLGTERNFLRDEGEAYEDLGLDGVAGTKDFGEANGRYDDSPNRARFLAHDFRQRYLRMTPEQRRGIDVYVDGGVRDVFNLGLSGDALASAMRALEPADSLRYTSFLDIPEATGAGWSNGAYNALGADYSRLGRNVFVRYGSDAPSIEDVRDGDGDHVGNAAQLVGRFSTFIKWTSERWAKPLGEPERVQSLGRKEEKVFFSEKLRAPRNFGIALPPGYDDPAFKDKRYPVLYLLHGYGMEAGGMTQLSILFEQFMAAGDVREMIIVYPSGKCCFVRPDGTKDCRDVDDDGSELARKPGYVRECVKGNFFVNRAGFAPGDETKYADSLFELMDHVDANYRVLAPRTVELGSP